MTARGKLQWFFAGVIAFSGFVYWLAVRERLVPSTEPTRPFGQGGLEQQTSAIDPPSSPPDSPATEPSVAQKVNKWERVMKETRLPLIGPLSIKLTDGAVSLLGLTPTQAEATNSSIKSFLNNVRVEEVRRAYVSVDPAGNEQIVVPAFDRNQAIDVFRAEISKIVGPDIADFIVDRIRRDSTMAVGSWEIRAYLEPKQDNNFYEVFERTVPIAPRFFNGMALAPEQRQIAKTPYKPSAFNPRTTHLWESVNALPKRAEDSVSAGPRRLSTAVGNGAVQN